MFEKKETKSKLRAIDKKKSDEAYQATLECCQSVQNKAQGVCAKVDAVLMASQ